MLQTVESFITDFKKYTLLEKTYHHASSDPYGGGYEQWIFNVNNKKYLLLGDIRFLEESKERVLFISLFVENVTKTGAPFWDATWVPDDNYIEIFKSMTELAFQIFLYRRYRYLIVHSCPEWHKPLQEFVNTLFGNAPGNIVKESFEYFNDEMRYLIETDYAKYFVSDIHTNPTIQKILNALEEVNNKKPAA